MRSKLATLTICTALLAGCASESSRDIDVTPHHYYGDYNGVVTSISIGKFDNRSNFLRGIFSDGVDRLGNQAKTILTANLQQTKYFNVLDRTNLEEIQQETAFKGKTKANIKAANYLATGDITEFGRKDVGDHQLFGILGKGKQQIAYAKTTLNIINADTSEVVCSAQGAGEFKLSNREIIGFGGTASYDSTLNGKVLDLAISNAVNDLINQINLGSCKFTK
ncbi:CsgG/HfaB family protein [Orbaceae bacterium ESL0721]|nr:CsgG/HfaB family protein [Orbaceae bacterium ESL0721]